jgi:hypothetical protein
LIEGMSLRLSVCEVFCGHETLQRELPENEPFFGDFRLANPRLEQARNGACGSTVLGALTKEPNAPGPEESGKNSPGSRRGGERIAKMVASRVWIDFTLSR